MATGCGAKGERVRAAIMMDWRRSDREIAAAFNVSPTTVGKHRRRLEEEGEIRRRVESGQPLEACLQTVSTLAIEPSPENDKLYDPVATSTPEFQAFVENVAENGILEPLVVSRDGFIISGHRRYAAAQHLGLRRVPVRIDADVSRTNDLDAFVRRLAAHNAQRVKTSAEVVREGVVGMDPDAWQAVHDYRQEVAHVGDVEAIELVGEKRRFGIRDKHSLRAAICTTVFEQRKDWPLSDRRVFYLLLNIPGLLRNDRQGTPFENSPACYSDVTNMVTRMRLSGEIPFDAIADETRPVVQWDTHRGVGAFVDRELEDLFSGYWRDLLQSQPNAVELLCEKNTVASCLKQVAMKYRLPMTSGRGYSSLPPRKSMVDRFRESGREKLIVIVVSDHDCEGADIPNAFGLSLRDDFGLDSSELLIVKAALTRDQVGRMDLHEGQIAKEDSARYKRFVSENGPRCWELEAVPIDTLREIVEEVIRKCLDLEAFERELEIEKTEQAELDQHRRAVRQALTGGLLN